MTFFAASTETMAIVQTLMCPPPPRAFDICCCLFGCSWPSGLCGRSDLDQGPRDSARSVPRNALADVPWIVPRRCTCRMPRTCQVVGMNLACRPHCLNTRTR